ncbi:MAG TPA: DMT family transporter [Anaeromyxobacter sp.]|nr:DMT family transporter [Anaeromyxobacter sp.]
MSGLSFGLMAVLARRASRLPGSFTAGHLSVVRFAVGALASLVLFRLRPGTYRPRNGRLLLARGVSGGLVVVFYFFALARIPAGQAGLLYNLFPVIATLMSIFALGERPTAHLLLGLVLATSGVALALGGGFPVRPGVGTLSALGAAVFAAASANVMRAMRGTENAPTIFFFFCLVGLPVVLPFAFDPWPASPAAWGLGLLVGLAAFAAQLLMADAYGDLSVSEAAAWLQLTPVAQVLLAWPLLDERPTASGFLGVVLAAVGVGIAAVLGRRAPRARELSGLTPPP